MAGQKRVKKFRYGMRMRGFSPGCQPKEGFLDVEVDPTEKYYNILVYSRRLTDKELSDYELDDINKSARPLTIIREQKGIKQKELAEMTGIPVNTIQNWEFWGMNYIPLWRCVIIADALGCDVRDLYEPDAENGNVRNKK